MIIISLTINFKRLSNIKIGLIQLPRLIAVKSHKRLLLTDQLHLEPPNIRIQMDKEE